MASTGGQNHLVHSSGTRFEGGRLNTGNMSDLQTLAAKMLTNVRTIHLCSEDGLPRPQTHSDWWQAAKARTADRRAIHAFRDELRADLIERGHPVLR